MGAIAAPAQGPYPTGVDFTPVRVAEPYHPQSVRGTVWRYELDASRANWINGTSVGEFTPFLPTVPIGGPRRRTITSSSCSGPCWRTGTIRRRRTR